MEKELIGEFREPPLFPIAFQAVPESTPPIDSALQAVVYQAVLDRARLKDQIAELKREGYVGESRTGLLEVLFIARSPEDSLRLEGVKRIVEKENGNREAILRFWYRYMNTSKSISTDSVAVLFYRQQVKQSPNGTLVQKRDGSWTKK